MLLRSALVLASAMGHFDDVKACMEQNRDLGVRGCVRMVLTLLMGRGIPLLVTTGRDSWERVGKLRANAAQAFLDGSPMLLVDRDCPDGSLVALVQPMGQMVFVDEGREGGVPRALRIGLESMTCMEMVTCVMAVPPVSRWHRETTFDGVEFNFNWDVSKHYQNVTTYIPNNALMNNMFNKPPIVLGKLALALGDYRASLASLVACPDDDEKPKRKRGRPKAAEVDARVQRLSSSNSMWIQWRRALLLEMALRLGDTFGVAFAVLGGVLPACMFGDEPRPFTAAALCTMPKTGLTLSVGVEVILQLTRPVENDHALDVYRPMKPRKRSSRGARARAARVRRADSESTVSLPSDFELSD